jgi:F-type H+-transporting ATPase subunit epsilon
MSLTVSVVTPSRQVLKSTCDSVKLPGQAGEMGVHPGHAAYIGLMGQGFVRTRGEKKEEVLVRGGFVQVGSNNVSILVDEAIFPKELDAEALKTREEEIDTELKNTFMPIEKRDALYEEKSWLHLCLKNAKS